MEYHVTELAKLLNGDVVNCDGLTVVSCNVTCDSKQVSKDGVFTAIRGTHVDGHQYIEDAFKNGAALAVVEDQSSLNGHAGIVVSNTRAAFSKLSSVFSGEPTKQMKIVGVTGTNGKTTIHWLVYHIVKALGHEAIRIGTIGHEGPQIFSKESLTTPDANSLHTLFKQAYDNGARYGVMEISSHALSQNRADDVEFDVGIFTNLTRDHLDYHKTMDNYYLAKKRLFDLLANNTKSDKLGVINIDDEYGKRLAADCRKINLNIATYGIGDSADWKIEDFNQDIYGSHFSLRVGKTCYPIQTVMIGLHNAYNLTAALIACHGLGLPFADVIKAAAVIPVVSGRLEPVGQNGIGIYVDYAHTPDALIHALQTLKSLPHKRLWVIFGCGGDRDRGKRPQMAEAAVQYADKVVVTSDNPRTEDPHAIIKDILSTGCRADLVEVDRKKAILAVLKEAREGDIVLIAGKGHEDYQIIGTEKHFFSDQAIVKDFWKENCGNLK